MAKLALFIALSEEMEYAITEMNKFGRFLGPDPLVQLKNGQTAFQFELKKFPQRENRLEVHLIKGMGNVLSAAHVGTAFGGSDTVRLALLVGISGSLETQSVGLGDVVVSNSVKYYGPDKIYHVDENKKRPFPLTREVREAHIQKGVRRSAVLAEPLPQNAMVFDDRDLVYGNNVLRFLRDQVFHEDRENIGHLFVEDLNGAKDHPKYNAKSATLLGSNWVIDSATYSEYLRQKNDWIDFDYYYLNNKGEYESRCRWDEDVIVAADMESYGFFKAVAAFSKQVTNVKAYAVRGISDLCAGKSEEDVSRGNENRKVATENCTNAALRLVQYYLGRNSYSYDV